MSDVLSESPSIMQSVNWLRLSLVKCRGVLSPERERRFSMLDYPFVGTDGELCVTPSPGTRLPSRSLHNDVSSLKANDRKRYMSLVLAESKTPIAAIGEVKKQTK